MTKIEKAVYWAVNLAVELEKALEDNKMNVVEVLGFWDNAIQVPAIAKSLKHFPEEWEQYQNDSIFWAQVTVEIEDRLKLKDDLVSELVVNVLKAGIAIKDVVLTAKAISDKKKGFQE